MTKKALSVNSCSSLNQAKSSGIIEWFFGWKMKVRMNFDEKRGAWMKKNRNLSKAINIMTNRQRKKNCAKLWHSIEAKINKASNKLWVKWAVERKSSKVKSHRFHRCRFVRHEKVDLDSIKREEGWRKGNRGINVDKKNHR